MKSLVWESNHKVDHSITFSDDFVPHVTSSRGLNRSSVPRVSPQLGAGLQIVEAAPAAFWLPEVEVEFAAIVAKGPNWDGYGAQAVSAMLVESVLRWMSDLQFSSAPRPSVSGTADGGVSLEFGLGGAEVHLEIAADRSVSVYVLDVTAGWEWEGPYRAVPLRGLRIFGRVLAGRRS